MKTSETIRKYGKYIVIRQRMETDSDIFKSITVQKDMGDYYETINPNSDEARNAILKSSELIDKE